MADEVCERDSRIVVLQSFRGLNEVEKRPSSCPLVCNITRRKDFQPVRRI